MGEGHSHLVLDKSFFDGCTLKKLETIARAGTRFIVTGELFVEIRTTSLHREQSVQKLHKLSKYIDLLECRALLKYELDRHLPSSPVTAHFVRGTLNPNFSRSLTAEETRTVETERSYLEEKSPGTFLKIVQELVAQSEGFTKGIVCQPDMIREVYSRLRALSSRLPESNLLNESWALYRKLQIDLLARFDYIRSYSGEEFHLSKGRLSHDQIDFRVLTVGALVGSLATNETKMAEYFETICPAGILLKSESVRASTI